MRMTHHTRFIARAAIVSVLALAACGGDEGGDGGDGDGDGIAALLQQMPAIERSDDVIVYIYGDLVAASELAELDRPTELSSEDDLDALLEWAIAVSGNDTGDDAPMVAAPMPDVLNMARLSDQSAFADEVGWSLADVEQFLEYSSPPARFALIDGTVDTDAVEDAVGEARNDIWSAGEGDDFESNFDDVSAARPLGTPLRMAARDGLFAATPSSDMAGDFVDGEDLGGDEGFVAVAERLDEADVYGAYLASVRTDREGSPFDTVGIGNAGDDDGQLVVIVYHYADDDTAAGAVADVEEVLEGESLRTRQPWSEIFSSSEVVADGANVVATLRLAPDTSPAIGRNILFVGDSLVDF